MFDLIIKGGHLLDGTGTPARLGDVGVTGDTITAIGDLAPAEARSTVDLSAAGSGANRGSAVGAMPAAYVCPGFIDAHSHSDTYLLIEPSAPSKIHQGVTTEVTGNCGASAAPLWGAYRMPSDWADKTYPAAWHTVGEYRALLERARPAPNVAMLVGHNNLRAGVAGYANRPLTPDELDAARRGLEQCLDEGARGLSTGLIYAPGLFAGREEITALARVVAGRGGLYASHMRSEGDALLPALEEAIGIGTEAGLRVQISHLKTAGRANWDAVERALDRIEQARAAGLAVTADRYPYTASCTDLDAVLPAWAAEGGREAVLARLRDPAERARLADELRRSRPPDAWSIITVGSTHHPDLRRFQGVRLRDVMADLGVDAADAVLHLLDRDDLRTGAFFFSMSADNMLKILGRPYVMIGSDASLRAPSGPLSRDYPHPRAYGTFPRFLRMALDGETVSLPEAVRKMTQLPAMQFGLTDRGMLAVGKKADLVVFDPEEIRDRATYAAPHKLAAGIQYVVVNGTLTLARGKLTGRHAGRFL